MWYIYILECTDDSLYTGITDNIQRRFEEYSSGKGGHYTASNRPGKILYTESLKNRLLAEKES